MVNCQIHVTTAAKAPSPYPLDKQLGKSQSWSGHIGREKNISACARNGTSHPAYSPLISWLISSQLSLNYKFLASSSSVTVWIT
jgi:hypothetical protein